MWVYVRNMWELRINIPPIAIYLLLIITQMFFFATVERFSCYFLFGNEDVCLLHVGFHLASSAFVVACLIYTRAHCSTQNLLTCTKLYFFFFFQYFFSGVLHWKWRKYSAMCNELYALLHRTVCGVCIILVWIFFFGVCLG